MPFQKTLFCSCRVYNTPLCKIRNKLLLSNETMSLPGRYRCLAHASISAWRLRFMHPSSGYKKTNNYNFRFWHPKIVSVLSHSIFHQHHVWGIIHHEITHGLLLVFFPPTTGIKAKITWNVRSNQMRVLIYSRSTTAQHPYDQAVPNMHCSERNVWMCIKSYYIPNIATLGEY